MHKNPSGKARGSILVPEKPRKDLGERCGDLVGRKRANSESQSETLCDISKCTELDLHGVKALFPYDPYGCQVLYMKQVMRSLLDGTNGILESPTGTGKTLCLLTAALAWQFALQNGRLPNLKANAQSASKSASAAGEWQGKGPCVSPTGSAVKKKDRRDKEKDMDKGKEKSADVLSAIERAAELHEAGSNEQQATRSFERKLRQGGGRPRKRLDVKNRKQMAEDFPRIFYASRTHAQLSQVISELKKTPYYTFSRRTVACHDHGHDDDNEGSDRFGDRYGDRPCSPSSSRNPSPINWNAFVFDGSADADGILKPQFIRPTVGPDTRSAADIEDCGGKASCGAGESDGGARSKAAKQLQAVREAKAKQANRGKASMGKSTEDEGWRAKGEFVPASDLIAAQTPIFSKASSRTESIKQTESIKGEGRDEDARRSVNLFNPDSVCQPNSSRSNSISICRDSNQNREMNKDEEEEEAAQNIQTKRFDDTSAQDFVLRSTCLASRDHLCIHVEQRRSAKPLTGNALTTFCKKQTLSRNCPFHSGNDSHLKKQDLFGSEVFDLKGLRNMGMTGHPVHAPRPFCPFYAAREEQKKCSLIFLPYVYLLHSSMRERLGISFANDVIIIDEAHNLEATAEDSVSFEWTLADLDLVARACIDAPSYATSMPSSNSSCNPSSSHNPGHNPNNRNNSKTNTGHSAETAALSSGAPGLKHTDAIELAAWGENNLRALIEAVMNLPMVRSPAESAATWHPLSLAQFHALLTSVGIGFGSGFGSIKRDDGGMADLKLLQQRLAALALALDSASREADASDAHANSVAFQAQKIEDFARTLAIVWNPWVRSFAHGFTAAILEHDSVLVESGGGGRKSVTSSMNAYPRKLAFWCFAPHVALMDLLVVDELKCHSLLITSGTLKPIETTAQMLSDGKLISFPQVLENEHVIRHDQLFSAVVGLTPSNAPLSLTYDAMRNSKHIFGQVGNIVLETCHSIAKGGVMVFFPSYSSLTRYLLDWRGSGLEREIAASKQIFVESSDAAQTVQSLFEYAQTVCAANNVPLPSNFDQELNNIFAANTTAANSAAGATGRGGGRFLQDFGDRVKGGQKKLKKSSFAAAGSNHENGAVFFSVFRGRLSEGLSLADSLVRAVVIVGIPYPAVGDLRVRLKRDVLNQQQSGRGHLWYNLQASQAVNQAAGRVIRHRADYGAVLFLDQRYGEPARQRDLPAWIASNMKFRGFDKSQTPWPKIRQALTNFFHNKTHPALPQPLSTTGDSRASTSTSAFSTAPSTRESSQFQFPGSTLTMTTSSTSTGSASLCSESQVRNGGDNGSGAGKKGNARTTSATGQTSLIDMFADSRARRVLGKEAVLYADKGGGGKGRGGTASLLADAIKHRTFNPSTALDRPRPTPFTRAAPPAALATANARPKMSAGKWGASGVSQGVSHGVSRSESGTKTREATGAVPMTKSRYNLGSETKERSAGDSVLSQNLYSDLEDLANLGFD